MSALALPVVIEYWLAPPPIAEICAKDSPFAKPCCRIWYACSPLMIGHVPAPPPAQDGSCRDPNEKLPLKSEVSTLASRLARSRAPNFRKCLPSTMEV